MARDIKGITIEIGGDTTGLQNALKDVNKHIKTSQTELKDVNKLLKLDPTNTELIAQKQRILADAIKGTSEKLETLKEASKQAKEQLENGELGQDKYDALQREIIETEEKLRSLQEEAATTSEKLAKIGELGQKFQDAGNKITDVGKKISVASAAVTGLGVGAVKTAADFESGMSQVQATMGITKDSMSEVNGETVNTMDALSGLAKQMGAETAYSASECAEALNYLALAGYSTQEMMDTLPTVLNLAAAGGIDLAQASDMVTDAMSALGMETSEADRMVDQMAKTASSTNTSVAQLGEGILTIGATAKTVKGGTAELNTALGILANNGIKGSEGGTKLRNVIMSLQTPTDQAAKQMEALGVSVFDSEGNMRSMNDILGDLNKSMDGMTDAEKANIISTIFNKTDIAAVNALLANTGDTWDELQGSIEDSAGAAQQMAETQLDNLSGQLTKLKSAVEGVAIQFGEALMPVVKRVVEIIQGFVQRLSEMDAGTRDMIVRIGLLVAALGPLTVILGKTITFIGSAMTGYVNLAKAIGKLKVAASTGSGVVGKLVAAIGGISAPVVAVVAVIGTLVAAFVHLWNTNDEFREKMIAIWDGLKEKISGTVQGILDLFNSFGFEFNSIIEVVKAAWDAFCSVLAPVFETAWGIISASLGAALDVLLGVLQVFVSAFRGDWSGLWEGIKTIFSGVWDGITGILQAALDLIGNLIDTVLGAIKKVWGDDFNAIKQTTETVFGAINNAGSTAMAALQNAISTALNAIKTVFQTVWNAIKTVVDTVTNAIKNAVSTAWNAIKSTTTTVWNAVKTAIQTPFQAAKSVVDTVINGIKTSVTNGFNAIKNTVTTVSNSIKDAIKGAFDKAHQAVQNAVNKMKSLTNFTFSVPKLKLPHLSISGGFSINPPSVPHFSVQWYKDGGIMVDPTVFGINGMSLMAGGEAGAEAILPLEGFYTRLSKMLDEKLSMDGMEKYLAVIAQNSEKNIYLDGGTLVGKLAPGMNRQLNRLAAQEAYK